MTYDVVVIGAGPAGLAAATTAARHGARVALLDDAERPGGQYFRHRDGGEPAHGAREYAKLHKRLNAVDRLNGHRVWMIESGHPFTVHALRGHRDPTPVSLRATTLILATGAHDRVLPFPGWTLPGVYTAGAAQSLLTGQDVLIDGPVVVAGTGPFLLPVATGLASASGDVLGVYEANRPGRDLVRLLGAPSRAAESGGYAAALARHRIGYHLGQTVVAAHGTERLEAVTIATVDADWRIKPGSAKRVPCASLAIGHGFTPRLDLALTLGVDVTPGPDGTPVVAVSATQRTSMPGVYAVGEVCGVGGARLSLAEGALAGYAVTGTRPPGRLLTRRAALRRFAQRLAAAFPVGDGWPGWLDEDTIVCRCESVPVERITAALALGATDTRTVKLLSRAGMGPCQGRVCGAAVARLAGLAPSATPPRRLIAQPIRLGDLATDPTEH
ncbi:FAD-dependent oxidoreductase [Stackebrandtia soli]|uniref:FAD-dependent oxidoreductase n=1 Tax=Stackebrandtia soli TaxID=1892856 RepID=UPI0039E7AB40